MKPALFLAAFLGVILVGCTLPKHVSRDALHPKSVLAEGAVYVLKRPVNAELHLSVLPGAPLYWGSVTLVSDRWYPKVRKDSIFKFAIVPAGAKVLIKSVLRVWTHDFGIRNEIHAEFISGPYKGASAKMDLISKWEPSDDGSERWLEVCDPEYFEEESPNQALRTPASGTPAASASAEPTADRDAPVAPPPGIAGR